MVHELLEAVKENIKNYVTHRLFIVTLLAIVMFGVLIVRLFRLQIVEGEEHLKNFTYKIERSLAIDASRGNIYDRNGNLLAYNKLVYSVTFGNSSELTARSKELDISENQLKNQIVYETIQILEKNGDSIVNNFNIVQNAQGNLEFAVEGTALKRFLMDVYSVQRADDLKPEQEHATARQVFDYIASEKLFDINTSYSVPDMLKIMSIRYSLWLNRYQQYVPVTIALDVKKESMAQIQENTDRLLGMDVIVDSIRQYNDSTYMAHIIGYIGNISSEDMEERNKVLSENNQYTTTDMVGKVGLEKELENILRGTKGTRKMYVDNLGRVLEVNDTIDAVPGNDVYLTIDKDLEIYCYNALEDELAGILLSNMHAGTAATNDKGEILIPQHQVYFALFDNNVIDISHMASEKASSTEQSVYSHVRDACGQTVAWVETELRSSLTPMMSLSESRQDYMKYIYKLLRASDIMSFSVIGESDEMYKKYCDDKISLGEYLQYAVTRGACDVSDFDIDANYYTSEELYEALVDFIVAQIGEDVEFNKLVIENMIKNSEISYSSIVTILHDQKVIKEDDEDYQSFLSGRIGSYEFIRSKISKKDITPAQLGLDPCSGSIVVTDVNSGEVLAMVSYPSYDNNMLTNSIDPAYYARMTADKTTPLYNRATQQKKAPGSTFKMLTTIAAVSEGVLSVSGTIETKGYFDKIPKPARCWIYRGSHGAHGTIGIAKALEVSCNYFYYELGYRLGTKTNGLFSDNQGLEKIGKYASMFGFATGSGIELPEAEPEISDTDAVRSAIGQGTHNYTATQMSKYVTTIASSGTSYDLSLVKEVKNFAGDVVMSNTHKVSNQIELSSELWNVVHSGMRRVVSEHTASSALINRIHVAVAGKTGTAQEDKKRPAHAWFVSYAPYEKPEVSVTVQIPCGYSSGNAEELASFIYAYLYEPTILDSENVSGNVTVSD